MKCKDCKFSDSSRITGYFECHRRAPRPTNEDDLGAFWPQVYEDDWCGEFQPKEKKDDI